MKLTGAFTGGSVAATGGFCNGGQAPCRNETFIAIDGLLSLNGSLVGEFRGSLNHFSTTILGSCVTYFATISGSLTATPA